MKKKEKIIQICYVCKKEFTHKRNAIVKCCSDECRNIYKNLPEIKKLTYDNTKLSMIKKYGVSHPSKIQGFKNKIKKTKLERYGNENYVNVDKCKQTKMERYGDENYNNREKLKQAEYDNIINRLKINNLTLLENIERLKFTDSDGVIHDEKFNIHCDICGTDFKSHLSNGHIPICNNCYPSKKIGEKVKSEILSFLQENYKGQIDINNRKILKDNKELDFYLPDIKLAIEYDGILWHSEKFGGKDKLYHINKTKECEKKGIQLIHIFENEWIFKKNIVKSILLNILGKNEKYYARQCKIKIVNTDEKEKFLIDNHLQGNCNSKINIGLYKDDILLQIMTFSKSRFNKKYEYELTRFCNKLGISVIGGANKIFKYFLRNYNPKSIISYSDIRFFSGNFYEKLGFEYLGSSSPNYYYFKYSDQYNLQNRMKFQKHKLKYLLENYDDSISEKDNMINNNYDLIWDCGNKKYQYILK